MKRTPEDVIRKALIADGCLESFTRAARQVLSDLELAGYMITDVSPGEDVGKLVPAFFNVNEEGVTYGRAHAIFENALAVLRQYPNDSVTVLLVTPACLRYLTEEDYGLDAALADGMSDSEYARARYLTEEEGLDIPRFSDGSPAPADFILRDEDFLRGPDEGDEEDGPSWMA